MRRLPLFGTVTILLGLLGSSIASATTPVRIPWPSTDYTVPAKTCGFAVDVTVVADNETLTIFSDGSVELTGTLKLALSANGKTITRNVSGPVFVRPNADGSGTETLTGASFLDFAAGALGRQSEPMLAYTTGPVVLEFDKFENGQIVSYSHTSGTTENLCATLA
jgi:hypothetical protein